MPLIGHGPSVNDMVVDDPAPPRISKQTPGPRRERSSHHGRGYRHRGGRRGHDLPPRARESNSDAMSAFTRFFRAEAQASEYPSGPRIPAGAYFARRYPLEELAIRKEAHAFDQLLRAERSARTREFSPYRPGGRNIKLDNRHPPQGHPFRNEQTRRPPRHTSGRAPRNGPTTAAQVIAEVTNNAAAILAPSPAPAVVIPDPGPDVEEIIAAAEQLDLEQSGHLLDITPDDVFGRYIPVGLLLVNTLTLLVLIAAFASVSEGASPA
ncbi:uncharacterized protein HD556DRAFT_1304816 [Suillus plorans]|uniref:Uncharacterized protein n=1 Tax=Suillus plorans TaxID=116603 RepID=A0A9P7DQP5_9AGAM|nr:uncharacterized protein HD556DRAFT_1304816 [Suillus plorans]KAG1800819.1 hypothetical protein HD556DRAFT_1304816 [Suillus plorans]